MQPDSINTVAMASQSVIDGLIASKIFLPTWVLDRLVVRWIAIQTITEITNQAIVAGQHIVSSDRTKAKDFMRHGLPQRRPCDTLDLRVGSQLYQVTVGFYANGGVGEVFVAGAKCGSDLDAVMRDAAILLSLALQYGVPVETIAHAITRESNGSASSIIGAVVDRLPILELPI
jgi:hypothetical protein